MQRDSGVLRKWAVRYKSGVLDFAVPRAGLATSEWTYGGLAYRVVKKARMAIFGREMEAAQIIQSREGVRKMSFLYAESHGLIAFQSLEKGAPTFFIENACGLAAPPTCRD